MELSKYTDAFEIRFEQIERNIINLKLDPKANEKNANIEADYTRKCTKKIIDQTDKNLESKVKKEP